MIADTRAIVIRQVRTVNGRRVIRLFTEQFGKVSAGVSVNERSRNRTALALNPFTLGNFELFKSRDYFNLNKAQTIHSFYDLGTDVDKYFYASYGLELLDKVVEEGQKEPGIFQATVDFLTVLESRKSRFGTILLAYKVKLLQYLGVFPELDSCVSCGSRKPPAALSVRDGGILCEDCAAAGAREDPDSLIFQADFAMINVLRYMLDHPVTQLQKLALDPDLERRINEIIDRFITYNLDPGEMKSVITPE